MKHIVTIFSQYFENYSNFKFEWSFCQERLNPTSKININSSPLGFPGDVMGWD